MCARLFPEVGATMQRLDDGTLLSFFGPESPLSRVNLLGLNGPFDATTLDTAQQFFFARPAPGMPVTSQMCMLGKACRTSGR